MALNTLDVAGILDGVNYLRAENTDDFVDETKNLYYVNLVINQLNKMNDYHFMEKSATYAVSTASNKFYLLSTLLPDGDVKKVQK